MKLPIWKPRGPIVVGVVLALALGAMLVLGLRPEPPAFDPLTTVQHEQAQAEMAAMGSAMAAWIGDQIAGSAPALFTTCLIAGRLDVSTVPAISSSELEALLVPSHLGVLHPLDPWGTPYELGLNTTDPLALDFGFIRSAARDGDFEGRVYTSGWTRRPDDDLVWVRGGFLRGLPPAGEIGRQQQTLAEMVHVGVAMLAWSSDQVARFDGGSLTGPPSATATLELSGYAPIDYATASSRLVPYYAACLPELDPWGTPYDYRMNDASHGSAGLAIRSAGRNGLFETSSYPLTGFPADQFDQDLVWADGFFLRAPLGDHATIFTDGFEQGLWGSWTAGS